LTGQTEPAWLPPEISKRSEVRSPHTTATPLNEVLLKTAHRPHGPAPVRAAACQLSFETEQAWELKCHSSRSPRYWKQCLCGKLLLETEVERERFQQGQSEKQ
jgi:hypothetical protein